MPAPLTTIGHFIRRNPVLCVAAALAAITALIVPPDAKYLSYPDYKTLSCLFCTLAMVCALKNIRFFTILAQKIVRCTGNTRAAILTLVTITFLGSMLIANDMALLTFLPLGCYVLHATGKEKYLAFTVIMQNIAANLGGMLTPFGNPQNLYLYNFFSIPTPEFMRIMAPPFAAAVTLITICCLFIRPEPLRIEQTESEALPPARTALYLLLFALSIVIVFRVIPFWIGLIVIPAALLWLDRDALKAVDYPLLLTFLCFFTFAGNMARIPALRTLLEWLLQKNTLIFSVLSCQFISNVPSAILLSQFTQDYRALLLGVNIGGCGTLIASLASLISFREYSRQQPGHTGRYILLFSAFNFGFLLLLSVFCSFLCR